MYNVCTMYMYIHVKIGEHYRALEAGDGWSVPGHRAGHADIVRVPAGQHAVAQQTVHMNRYNAITANIFLKL